MAVHPVEPGYADGLHEYTNVYRNPPPLDDGGQTTKRLPSRVHSPGIDVEGKGFLSLDIPDSASDPADGHNIPPEVVHELPAPVSASCQDRRPLQSSASAQSHSCLEVNQYAQLSSDAPEAVNPLLGTASSKSAARAEVLSRLRGLDSPNKRKGPQGINRRSNTSLLLGGFRGRMSNSTNAVELIKNGYYRDRLASVLEEVAYEGRLELVEEAIILGADPNYRRIQERIRHWALQNAVAKGHTPVVDFLLQKGAQFTCPSIDDSLVDAVGGCKVDLSICLLSHGADWRTHSEDIGVFQNLLRNDVCSAWRILQAIVQRRDFEYLADVHSTTRQRQYGTSIVFIYSALSYAVSTGWVDAVQIMLTKSHGEKSYLSSKKKTRRMSPINCLTKRAWMDQPDTTLEILDMLLEADASQLEIFQETDDDWDLKHAGEIYSSSALGRAILGGSAKGVERILQDDHSRLESTYFRGPGISELKVPNPYSCSGGLWSCRLDSALGMAIATRQVGIGVVLLRHGADPRPELLAACKDPEVVGVLEEMVKNISLVQDAFRHSIVFANVIAVRMLLDVLFDSTDSSAGVPLSFPPLYDLILKCKRPDASIDTREDGLKIIAAIVAREKTSGRDKRLPRPTTQAITDAIKLGNFAETQALLEARVIDSQILNAMAYRWKEPGSQKERACTALCYCLRSGKGFAWQNLLLQYGANCSKHWHHA